MYLFINDRGWHLLHLRPRHHLDLAITSQGELVYLLPRKHKFTQVFQDLLHPTKRRTEVINPIFSFTKK
jgi:hypothetical protein